MIGTDDFAVEQHDDALGMGAHFESPSGQRRAHPRCSDCNRSGHDQGTLCWP